MRLARARIEANQFRYFEQSLDPLWTADLDGRLLLVNPAWERALGYSSAAAHKRRLADLAHPHDRELTVAELAHLSEGQAQTVTFRNRCRAADGEYPWFEWSAHIAPDEGVIHGVTHDVTAQRTAEQRAAGERRRLAETLAERTRELDEARAETLQLLAAAAGYRDDESSEHSERVGVLAGDIATELGLSGESVALLRTAAPLHDVGKLAVPDEILFKQTSLSPREQELAQTHTELGAQLLFGSRSPVLQLAGMIAASHHERWDGSGYPKGLAGESIPLVGRVVAVADMFDVLTHERPDVPALTIERALTVIERGSGTHFDPGVVEALSRARPVHAAASVPLAPPSEPRHWHRGTPAHAGRARRPASSQTR